MLDTKKVNYAALSSILHESIALSAQITLLRNPINEPAFVSDFFQIGIPYIQQHIHRAVKSKMMIDVGGVFCHQSPYVEYSSGGNNPATTEIGDLLVIVECLTQKERWKRALLLQYKHFKGRCKYLHSLKYSNNSNNDKHQYHLYYSWPEFKYKNGDLKGKKRQVCLPHPHLGAQFVAIYNDFQNPVLFTHLPDYSFNYTSYANTINELIVGLNGREFYDQSEVKGDGWCQVIWDLIRVTGKKVYTQNNAGINKQSRGTLE